MSFVGLCDAVAHVTLEEHDQSLIKLHDRFLLAQPQFRIETLDIHKDAIAIIGAACRLPGANNLDELADLLRHGRDHHRELPLDRFDLHGSFRASQCEGFMQNRIFYGNFLDDIAGFDNTLFGISAKESASMDPQQRLLLELSYEALEDSGYLQRHDRQAGDPVGCFVGACYNEYLENTSSHAPTAYTAPGTIRAFLCGRVSFQYGWSGPSEVIDTACSASLVAVHRACQAIKAGECEMALAGGVNLISGTTNYLDLGKAGFLSKTGQCKPFDHSADGYCRSDGAGFVMLKSLTQAQADGDKVLGVILSTATQQSGLSSSITLPDSGAQKKLYSAALQKASLKANDITYVEAHGTGTQAGDPLEAESIRAVLGRTEASHPKLHIGSIKGNIGHCETAAGIASLMKVLVMLRHRFMPAMKNFEKLNPKIPPFEIDGIEIPVSTSKWDAPKRNAMINSYGAAGSNCAIVCTEAASVGSVVNGEVTNDTSDVAYPIVISAASRTSLSRWAKVTAKYLQRNLKCLNLRDVAFTLGEHRRPMRYMTMTKTKTLHDLAQILQNGEHGDVLEFQPSSKKCVLVFSGQTDRQVALNKNMYETFELFRNYLDRCNAEFVCLGFPSLFPHIFQSEPIDSIVHLQVGIFAVQWACARSWIDCGLKVDALLGHSIGEFAALAISGVLSLRDALTLVAHRARLIEEQWGSETGSMISVIASPDALATLTSRIGTCFGERPLEVACYNAPTSVVLAGPSRSCDALEAALQGDPELSSIKFRRINTSHGFHSYLVEPILSNLHDVARSLTWNQPQIHIELCTEEAYQIPGIHHPALHARKPVQFTKAVQRIEDRLGPCLWFEAGMDSPIIPMVKKACKANARHDFVSMPSKKIPSACDIVTDVVCEMWQKGLPISHWMFRSATGLSARPIWLPPYQFDKQVHWVPHVDQAANLSRELKCRSFPEDDQKVSTPPIRLVVPRVTTSNRTPDLYEFTITTNSERFQCIVGGHRVCDQALCPASMYLECVTMGLSLLGQKVDSQCLRFENLSFEAPLGTQPKGEVLLTLTAASQDDSFQFTVRTVTPQKTSQHLISHCSGRVVLSRSSDLMPFTQLVRDSWSSVDLAPESESIASARIYKLFANVVTYANFMQAIKTVKFKKQEVAGRVKRSSDQPNMNESTVSHCFDAVFLDGFIQVIGLAINTSDAVDNGEVAVCIGVDGLIAEPKRLKQYQDTELSVYGKYRQDGSNQMVGEIFVLSSTDELVATFSGCRFRKLQKSRLVKTFASLGSKPEPDSEVEQKRCKFAR